MGLRARLRFRSVPHLLGFPLELRPHVAFHRNQILRQGHSGRTHEARGVRGRRPVLPAARIGDLVEVEARLIYTGRTSMHVSVHVRSGNPARAERRLTTHCLVVFVALTPEGRSTAARRWEPTTDEDVNLFQHAQHLIELRSAVDDIDPVIA